ncbi:MAG: hypothetical protein MUF64_27060 [Polyangiaceae bacterium]|jgi:polyhydroxybutyrate depolymerase|nr:hypothetical protein [Polyangiaceae bacterium]
MRWRWLALAWLVGCTTDHTVGGPLDSTSPQSNKNGCEVGDWPTTPGEHRRTLMYQQQQRRYAVLLPQQYDPCVPSPTLVVLQGQGAYLLSFDGSTISPAMERASALGYVVVVPEATTVGVRSEWNGPLAPEEVSAVDDLGFVAAMLGDLKGRDAGRTYLLGQGEGEIFGHFLAAQLPVFAGFIGMGGTLGGRRTIGGPLEIPPTPERPLSVMLIHGRDDPFFPIEGGVVNGRFLLGVEEAERFWVTANGCTEDPYTSKQGIIGTRVHACPEGREVVLLGLDGIGNQIPEGSSVLRLQLALRIFDFFGRNQLLLRVKDRPYGAPGGPGGGRGSAGESAGRGPSPRPGAGAGAGSGWR